MTDWSAQHAGIAFASAGLDMVMSDSEFWGDNLPLAIKNGSMEQARLDDMGNSVSCHQLDFGCF